MPEISDNTGGLHPSVWKITAVAVLGSFLANLDATVVNVSLSSLAAELHSTLNIIQWVTSGPTLTKLCATFLAWKLKAVASEAVNANAFTATFLLLSLVQALLCIIAYLLPLSLETPSEAESEEASATSVELMSE